MRASRCIRWVGSLLVCSFLCWPAFGQETTHYTRFRDAKWYARQLELLQDERAKTDTEIKELVEARQSGKGTTDAVALDQEPESVTSEGQMEVLQKRRILLLRQIDELEEQARHNAIVPGELRSEYGPELPATPKAKISRAEKELQNLLAQEKEHLANARKEADLLQRDQKLKTQQEYSNPEPRSRRSEPSELGEINRHLAERRAEVQETEQKVAELEDQIEDLRRNSPVENEKTDAAPESDSSNAANDRSSDEKNEAYWRKQFSAIDDNIRTAQTELDILQRELNVGLIQYYPNPATAMKESVTRKAINEQRNAIEEKKKEIGEFKKQRDELEDALRHAGGPAGWSR